MARYTNPKAITGKAESTLDMVREVAHAMDTKQEDARDALIRKGYAKVSAELRWTRANVKPKPTKKPAKKAKGKARAKKDPAPALVPVPVE